MSLSLTPFFDKQTVRCTKTPPSPERFAEHKDLALVPHTSKAPAVAPLAGAWIETSEIPRASRSRVVAPLAGAWIETPGQG